MRRLASAASRRDARVQKKSTVPLGRRRDRHEHQAEMLARRFMRGEMHLGADVTCTSTASFSLPTSGGGPLPTALRVELERAFDAKLRDVRIHAGAPAAGAAAEMGARAFTSGASIYFSAGAYEPGTNEGKELIAHEVVHVLQQTGRMNSAGEMEARSVTGSGLPQMQDEIGPDVPGRPEWFTSLANAHRRLGTTGSNLEATITEVSRLIGGQLVDNGSRPAFAWPLVLAIRQQQLPLPDARSRGFVVDCLKWLGYFHTAKALLDADGRLEVQTLVFSREFMVFLLSGTDALQSGGGVLWHSTFRQFWTRTLVAAYRQFFLSPHAPPPPMSDAIADGLVAAVEERPGPGVIDSQPRTQERVLLGWNTLIVLDRERIPHCERIRRELEQRGGNPTERMRGAMEELKTSFSRRITDESVPSHLRDLASALVVMMDADVLPLWRDLHAEFESVRRQFETFTIDAVMTGEGLRGAEGPPFPVNADDSAIAQEVRRILLAQARIIFAEGSGTATAGRGADSGDALPSSADYAQRLTDFASALEGQYVRRGALRDPVVQQIDQRIGAAAANPRRNARTLRSLLLLSWLVDSLIVDARRYDRALDEQTPHFPDELGAHRVEFAHHYALAARWMGWTEILPELARALPVARRAEGEPAAVPQLWLISDWRPDSGEVSRMATDFPERRDEPVLTGLPITIDHLVAWYSLRYDERVAVVLRNQLLQERQADETIRIDWQAFEALRQTPEQVREQMLANAEAEYAAATVPAFANLQAPQRFVVDEWQAVIPAGMHGHWYDLLSHHPKTELAINRRLGTDYGHIYPDDGRVFAWVLPPLTDLYRLIEGIGAIRSLTNFTGSENDYLRFLQETHGDDFLLWQRIDALIARQIEARHRPTREALPALYTRFTTLRRRELTADIRARLETYLADRRVTGGRIGETPAERVRRIEGPQYALQEIQRFALDVVPAADADAQTTLLILRLADQIERLFTTQHPEYRVATEYYALAGMALDFSGDRERMRAMVRISNEYDVAAGNIALVERNLTAARAHLQRAREAIEANARTSQANLGFESDTRDGNLILMSMAFRSGEIWPTSETNPDPRHQWHRNMRLGPEGELDESTGDVIRILEVFRQFQYFPHVGTPGGQTPYAAPIYWNENGVEHGGQTGVAIPHDPLFRIQIGTDIRTVHADDAPELLAYYNELFMWRGFQIHMENLAGMTEAYMQWMMAAASVAFPPVAYAELAINVVRLVTTDELQQLIDHLANDPRAFVTDLITRLTSDLFHPENIWRFVLLSGQHNPWNSLRTRRQPGTSLRAAPARTRLGRIVRSLRMLGERFHNALNRIRIRARGPIRVVQGNIAMRPRLSWIMRRAIRVLQILPDLVPPELVAGLTRPPEPENPHAATRHPASLMGLVEDRIDETAADLRTNTINLLEAIQHFELPSELVDLNVATELIIQLIADRFGPRARIIRMLMDLTPIPQEEQGRFTGTRTLYQYLAAAVAQGWRASGLDPNQLWIDEVVPEIQPRFIALRDEFVTDMYTGINSGLGAIGVAPLERPTDESLPVTEIISEPLDTQASLSPSPAARSRGAWRLSRSSAHPLAAHVRRPFEASFGQRFSHVRLTTGDAARSATGPIGADAVTSGSHVYLRPGLSPSSSTGRRVLAHELTHVVQQTGSHPLGGGAPPAPRVGPPGSLRVDPPSEAAAERAAGNFMRGEPSPLAPQTATPLGAAPRMSAATMRSIIETLTEVREGTDFTADASTARANGLSDARALFELIWQKLTALQPTNPQHFAAFTANPSTVATPNVRERIKEHVTRNKADLTRVIEGIVRLSQRPRAGAAQAAAAGQTASQPATELNRGRFVELLENYIFAERGIGIDTTGDATWHTVSNVKVVSAALDRIGGTSELWSVAMRASFVGRSVTVDANLQNAVRQRIRALGADVIVWDSNEFKLSRSFVDDFLESQRMLGVTISDVPRKSEYLAHATVAANTLAVRTHGAFSGLGISNFNRESHHTTQFLLAEFFGNAPDAANAFPSHHRQYPAAVQFASGTRGPVRAIDAPGHTAIRVAALDPTSGRGDAMPSILLSARCHRRGNLHLLQEALWTPDQADRDNKSTQGFAIGNAFNRAIGAAEPRLMPRPDSDQAKAQFLDYVQRFPTEANLHIYRAAVATYHWMRDHMLTALDHALKTEELAYYRTIAALHHTTGGTTDSPDLDPAWDLHATEMQTVFNAARENNDRIMSGFGWPTP